MFDAVNQAVQHEEELEWCLEEHCEEEEEEEEEEEYYFGGDEDYRELNFE